MVAKSIYDLLLSPFLGSPQVLVPVHMIRWADRSTWKPRRRVDWVRKGCLLSFFTSFVPSFSLFFGVERERDGWKGRYFSLGRLKKRDSTKQDLGDIFLCARLPTLEARLLAKKKEDGPWKKRDLCGLVDLGGGPGRAVTELTASFSGWSYRPLPSRVQVRVIPGRCLPNHV